MSPKKVPRVHLLNKFARSEVCACDFPEYIVSVFLTGSLGSIPYPFGETTGDHIR
jgi:hypothetical protein